MMAPAPAPAAVSLSGLTKTFPRAAAPAVSDLSLELAAGTLTALLGPSGCGKSTTLRMVAGLLEPDAGDVRVGHQSLAGVPAERRPVGMVFQRPLLFPHLDVAGNVGFGLRMRGVPRHSRRRLVEEMLALVQLGGLEGRGVDQLSGGQQQRVALARALVTSPQVLLLDEPFSQLDTTLRTQMRTLLADVQRRLGVTTLLVTHDQEEAVELADRIALLDAGRVEQYGTPSDFYRRPASLTVARFFGAGNFVSGTARDGRFHCALGEVLVAGNPAPGPGTLVVRPESLGLTNCTSSNVVHGRVTAADYRGTHIDVTVTTNGVALRVRAAATDSVPVGAPASVHLPPDACTVLPDNSPIGDHSHAQR